MNTPDLSTTVVVCAHTDRRWSYLAETLCSIEKQSHAPAQTILVIDNNPALLARARETFSNITVMSNQGERGLSGGRNTGVAAATGDIIAFIDDDAAADPAWLGELVKGYADPHVMGVGGSIQPAWETGRPRWFPSEFDWVVGCTYTGMPLRDAVVRNVFGCNMSFRASACKIGGDFKLGRSNGTVESSHEDTYYCIHLTRLIPGAKVLYKPSATVHHHVPGSRSTLRYFIHRCYVEGLSKARLGRIVGQDRSLNTEGTYVATTLPKGVMRGLRDAVLRLDLSGLGRAFTILLGLTVTSAGYARSMLSRVPSEPPADESGTMARSHVS